MTEVLNRRHREEEPMRYPPEWYQLDAEISAAFSALRPSQQRGLSWWVYGTILAHSACQTAVLTALTHLGGWHALRQYLREWLADGADKAAPCQTQIEVSQCFAPLLRWLLRWWQGETLPLAVDVTAKGDQVVVLVVSVLYRNSAIPVAWQVLPANEAGAWMTGLLRLLRQLRPAVPASMTVIVAADRGLWSPRLWKRIHDLGWHALLRVQGRITFQPTGGTRVPVRTLVPGPGHAWVGAGVAFKQPKVQRQATLLVVWEDGHADPWVLLTDLAPHAVGVVWYGLRCWIECGFRALKRLGWQWQRTRRTDPERMARHWLVLAVATLWTVAYGTRLEDAETRGVAPERLRSAPSLPAARPARQPRAVSVFRRGLTTLSRHLARGRLWTRLWLQPDPWPTPDASLVIHYHAHAP
jgi:hypothetical protein